MSFLDSFGFAKGEITSNPGPTIELGIGHRLVVVDAAERMLQYFPFASENEANPLAIAEKTPEVISAVPQINSPEAVYVSDKVIETQPISVAANDEATQKALAIAAANQSVESALAEAAAVSLQPSSNIVPLLGALTAESTYTNLQSTDNVVPLFGSAPQQQPQSTTDNRAAA